VTRRPAARAALALLGVGLTAPALAQGIDLSNGGPINVTAAGGFEWHEDQQEVVAYGDARATRGTVTVLADRLIAFYRKRAAAPGAAPPGASASGAAAIPAAAPAPAAPPAPASGAGNALSDADNGNTEVYRLQAEGHVRILTPTDEAVGDQATYDIDQAVLVLTGQHLKLTTPQDIMTARDSMEYWSQKHMAVGRGDAVVLTSDGRRIAADILVGYTTPDTGAPKPVPVAAKPGADPLAGSGKLQRVEAYGNVEVRTVQDTVRGERGVYLPDSGMARIIGHVRITHGQNQLNGPAADVNMKTGIAHLVSGPQNRVEGLIMPNDTGPKGGATPGQGTR
jgi:lipopolysaccharide export system protein LptA